MRTKRTFPQGKGENTLKGRFQAVIWVLKAFVPTKSRPSGRRRPRKATKGPRRLKTSFFTLKKRG